MEHGISFQIEQDWSGTIFFFQAQEEQTETARKDKSALNRVIIVLVVVQ